MQYKLLSIILPTYNERGNIVRLIKAIISTCQKNKIGYKIIVIDDDSPDGTYQHVKKTFPRHKNVKSYQRTKEKCLASAILYGINKATGNYICVMDTDFNHDPKEIPLMYKLAKEYELVIGSRYVGHGGMENKTRQFLSYLFNIFLKLILGHGVNDNLSGFFIINRDRLSSLPLKHIFQGFGDFFMRLIFHAHKRNFSIIEIPVFYKNRTYGQSKSNFLGMFVTYTLSAISLRLLKQP